MSENNKKDARLVGKVGEHDVYLCRNPHVTLEKWPRAGAKQQDHVYYCGPEGWQGEKDCDLLVNEVALADLKERWGFVPLAEARPEYEGLDYVGTWEGLRVHVGDKDALRGIRDVTAFVVDSAEALIDDGGDETAREWLLRKQGLGALLITPECLKAMLVWALDGWTDLPRKDKFTECPCGCAFGISITPCVACGLRLAKPTTLAGTGEEATTDSAPVRREGRQTAAEPSPGSATHPGLTYVGTAGGRRFLLGSYDDLVAAYRFGHTVFTVSFAPGETADLSTSGHWPDILSGVRAPNQPGAVGITPQALAAFDEWVDWETRHQFDIVDIRVFAGKVGYQPPWPERILVGRVDHEALANLAREMPNGGIIHCTKGQVEELRAMKEGAPTQAETADSTDATYLGLGSQGQLVDRHPPKTPPPQPILEVKDGRVSLHLERLAEDNLDARRQLHEAMDAVYKGVAETPHPLCLYNRIGDMTLSLFKNPGWPRDRYLRAIEDAAHQLAVAQCKAENK